MKFKNTQVWGFDHALRGMRNAKNSWSKADSGYKALASCLDKKYCENCTYDTCGGSCGEVYIIGPNDMKLIQSLIKGGPEHRKFMRQIFVSVDITAPLYWWKEFDTYKVGTVANSCSTMHKIQEKEFTTDDFSCEHLDIRTKALLEVTINILNDYRKLYIEYNPDDFEIKGCPSKKDIWWQMIQLLPSSYNQTRNVMLNYEVLANMYYSRKNHKLDEWREFCKWIEDLPYSDLIILR